MSSMGQFDFLLPDEETTHAYKIIKRLDEIEDWSYVVKMDN